MMAKNYERDEREEYSRRQGNEDYERDRWQDMSGRERFGGSGMRYGQQRQHPDWGRRDWEGGEMHGRERQGWEEYGNQPEHGRRDWNEREGMTGQGWNQWNQWNQWGDRRMEGRFAGRGPRSYKRSDDRIEEDINDRLTQHPMIDATDIEVGVQNGEVTLRGHVDHREARRMAEDVAESVSGVKDVTNQIKIRQRGEGEDGKHETESSGKRKAS
jgi:hypothetical protein